MTYDRAAIALSRARADFAHHLNSAMLAETPRAQARHARKARVAQSRIRDAARDMGRLGCDLSEAWEGGKAA